MASDPDKLCRLLCHPYSDAAAFTVSEGWRGAGEIQSAPLVAENSSLSLTVELSPRGWHPKGRRFVRGPLDTRFLTPGIAWVERSLVQPLVTTDEHGPGTGGSVG